MCVCKEESAGLDLNAFYKSYNEDGGLTLTLTLKVNAAGEGKPPNASRLFGMSGRCSGLSKIIQLFSASLFIVQMNPCMCYQHTT